MTGGGDKSGFWNRLIERTRDVVAPDARPGPPLRAEPPRADPPDSIEGVDAPASSRAPEAPRPQAKPPAKKKGRAKAKAKAPSRPARNAEPAESRPDESPREGRPAETDAAKVIPFPRPRPRLVPAPARPVEPKLPAPLPDAPPPAPEAAPSPEPATPPEAPRPEGWFARLRVGLARTSTALGDNIQAIFTKRRLDEATLQELEEVLIQADLGLDMAARIADAVGQGRYDKEIAPDEVRAVLAGEVARVLAPVARPLEIDAARRPHVILVVGVNGTGKTTTIGKLAHRFAADGRSVVLCAGDTFRAAAIDQLKVWGERTGAAVVARGQGADAAGLAYDALEQARRDQADVLMIDTAGRLQNKADLMAGLSKMVRVLKKLDRSAPHSVLLVLDATTGQNAVAQAEVFGDIAGVTGLVMTKLDGTARGGILVAIADRFGLPVHAVGVGEGLDDLQPFDAGEFAAAIAGRQA